MGTPTALLVFIYENRMFLVNFTRRNGSSVVRWNFPAAFAPEAVFPQQLQPKQYLLGKSQAELKDITAQKVLGGCNFTESQRLLLHVHAVLPCPALDSPVQERPGATGGSLVKGCEGDEGAGAQGKAETAQPAEEEAQGASY